MDLLQMVSSVPGAPQRNGNCDVAFVAVFVTFRRSQTLLEANSRTKCESSEQSPLRMCCAG
jgi:hypothetical protein